MFVGLTPTLALQLNRSRLTQGHVLLIAFSDWGGSALQPCKDT
jgi:hypothetical protein